MGMGVHGMKRDEHGAYCWTGVVDRAYEHKVFGIVFGVVGGVCALFIIMSLMLGGDMIGIVLLSCAGGMAVAGGVCWLFDRHAGKRKQRYIMTEDAVFFCQRRRNVPFTFSSIKRAIVCPSRNMIDLYQAVGSSAVFVPPEDYEFVRDFILQRLPASAIVEYE